MKAGFRILAAAALVISLVAVMQSCSSHNDQATKPPPAKELDSGNISAGGGQYVHTFTTVGTYNYHCAIHTSMTGTVTVTNGAPATPLAIGITLATGFSPANPTVGVGSTVTWTNNDPGTAHTVTSTP